MTSAANGGSGDGLITGPGAASRRSISPVGVSVPADPAMSIVVRRAASGLAGLTGFVDTQIADIKIAVAEVLIALIEHGAGEAVDIEFVVDDIAFVVWGHTDVPEFDMDRPGLQMCRTVLEGVCADHGFAHVEGQAQIWASVHRASAPSASPAALIEPPLPA